MKRTARMVLVVVVLCMVCPLVSVAEQAQTELIYSPITWEEIQQNETVYMFKDASILTFYVCDKSIELTPEKLGELPKSEVIILFKVAVGSMIQGQNIPNLYTHQTDWISNSVIKTPCQEVEAMLTVAIQKFGK